MTHFTNALLCGPKATVNYFVNNLVCFFAEALENSSKKELQKQEYEEEVKRRVAEQDKSEIKQEIVEYKQFKDTVNSILNVNFSTFDDSVDKELTGDDLVNTVEKIIETVIDRSLLNLDDPESVKHIKLITLTTLIAINKARLTEIMNNDEFDITTRDDLVEINTIYKFYTGAKVFDSVSCIQLNEFVTSQLLYETVTVIGETNDWNLEANMGEIIAKAYKRLEMESITNGKINGLDEIDAVSPIRFDNSILNVNLFDKNARVPRINKTAKEFLVNFLNTNISKEWVEDNNIIFDIERKIDPMDSNRDTGMANLKVLYEGGSICTLFYDLDLDSVTGNGYSIKIDSYNPLNPGVPYPMFVSIEKFPEVVSKFITSDGKYQLNNPKNPDSIVEYGKIVTDNCAVANNVETLWYYFDFSGMSKHFSFMTNEDKKTFSNNLTNIHNKINWSSIDGNISMPRMRIRKFDNANKFTLVSDSKTRQQLPSFNTVLDNNYKKYYNDTNADINPNGDIIDKNILVVKYNNGEVTISYNGKNIPFNVVQPTVQQPVANPALEMLNSMGYNTSQFGYYGNNQYTVDFSKVIK